MLSQPRLQGAVQMMINSVAPRALDSATTTSLICFRGMSDVYR